jgi:hypothetical protein
MRDKYEEKFSACLIGPINSEIETEKKSIEIELIDGAMSQTIKAIIIQNVSSARPVGKKLKRLLTVKKIDITDRN